MLRSSLPNWTRSKRLHSKLMKRRYKRPSGPTWMVPTEAAERFGFPPAPSAARPPPSTASQTSCCARGCWKGLARSGRQPWQALRGTGSGRCRNSAWRKSCSPQMPAPPWELETLQCWGSWRFVACVVVRSVGLILTICRWMKSSFRCDARPSPGRSGFPPMWTGACTTGLLFAACSPNPRRHSS